MQTVIVRIKKDVTQGLYENIEQSHMEQWLGRLVVGEIVESSDGSYDKHCAQGVFVGGWLWSRSSFDIIDKKDLTDDDIAELVHNQLITCN